MENTTEAINKPEEKATSKSGAKSKKSDIVLLNTLGKEVSHKDYFFGGAVPPGFEASCGKPVDREDLLAVFNQIFNPEDNVLFYKQPDKEVYIVIIPIKIASEIGEKNNSIDGDFQKHAISFLTEGSVNVDTLKMKLLRIQKFVKDRIK